MSSSVDCRSVPAGPAASWSMMILRFSWPQHGKQVIKSNANIKTRIRPDCIVHLRILRATASLDKKESPKSVLGGRGFTLRKKPGSYQGTASAVPLCAHQSPALG